VTSPLYCEVQYRCCKAQRALTRFSGRRACGACQQIAVRIEAHGTQWVRATAWPIDAVTDVLTTAERATLLCGATLLPAAPVQQSPLEHARYPATKADRRWPSSEQRAPSRQSPAGSPSNLSSDHGVSGVPYHSTTGRHGSLRCRRAFAGLGKSAHAVTKTPAHSQSHSYPHRSAIGPTETSITLLPHGRVSWPGRFMNRHLFAVRSRKLCLIAPASRIKLTFPRIGRVVSTVVSESGRSCRVRRAVKSTTQSSGAAPRIVLRLHPRCAPVCRGSSQWHALAPT
jgi:hypothetical protein